MSSGTGKETKGPTVGETPADNSSSTYPPYVPPPWRADGAQPDGSVMRDAGIQSSTNGTATKASGTTGRLRAVLLPAGVFLLVIGIGFAAYGGWRARSTPAPEVSPPGQADVLSRPAPPGWTQRFAWSEKISPTSEIAVGNNRIATINANGSLVVLNADTGALDWASKPEVISPTAQPLLAEAGGTPVAGILDGANLYLAPLGGDKSSSVQLTTIDLPNDSTVTWTSGSLLITGGFGASIVTDDLKLRRVQLPEGVQAMATDGNVVVAAPAQGSWLLYDANGGVEWVQPDKIPEGARDEPHVAWASRGVVLAWWEGKQRGSKIVTMHDMIDGRTLASATMSGAVFGQSRLELTVSPGRRLASAGPMLVDLESRYTTIYEDWSSTSTPNSDYLYGKTAGGKAVWNGADVNAMDPQTAVPWGVSDGGLAIVLDRVADGSTIVGGLVRG